MNEKSITVLIVRHAEINPVHENDPVLNSEGQARAQELVRIAGKAGISEIYSTPLERTRQTVKPLANHLGIDVREISDVSELVGQLISVEDGSVLFVAAHTNTIPMIISKLGGNPVSTIGEREFDNMYIVTFHVIEGTENKPSFTRVLQLKYGG